MSATNLLPNNRIDLRTPAQKRAVEARKKKDREARSAVHHVRVAQRRLGTLLKQAKDAGGDIHTMPLWRLVGYATYGRNPRALSRKMVTDVDAPNRVWGDIISSLPEGVSLHAISYGRGADKPWKNLRYLGRAFYGALAAVDQGGPVGYVPPNVPDRDVVGVILFDRLGRVSVNAGLPPLPQDVLVNADPAAMTENIDQAGLLADFVYPEEWCTEEGEMAELEAAFHRLKDNDQLKTFGL